MTRRIDRLSAAVLAVLLPIGCARVQPAPAEPLPPVASAPARPPPLPEYDRLREFAKLGSVPGTQNPAVTRAEVDVPNGRQVPVVHIVVAERVFFDTGQDAPLPGSAAALDFIAGATRRDVVGLQVTVVGHTDAVGGEAYNLDLSRRRATRVVAALAARHVPEQQLAAVPMGKNQPVASNDTAEGRARNRRVEFFISTDLRANEAAIRAAPFDAGAGGSDPSQPAGVAVLRPASVAGGPPQFVEIDTLPLPRPEGRAARVRTGRLAAPAAGAVLRPPPDPVLPQTPEPSEPVTPRAPDAVAPAPLGAARAY